MNSNGQGKRNELVQIKVSAGEKATLKQAAVKDGERQFTTWARGVLNRKAQQVLKRPVRFGI